MQQSHLSTHWATVERQTLRRTDETCSRTGLRVNSHLPRPVGWVEGAEKEQQATTSNKCHCRCKSS